MSVAPWWDTASASRMLDGTFTWISTSPPLTMSALVESVRISNSRSRSSASAN